MLSWLVISKTCIIGRTLFHYKGPQFPIGYCGLGGPKRAAEALFPKILGLEGGGGGDFQGDQDTIIITDHTRKVHWTKLVQASTFRGHTTPTHEYRYLICLSA